MEVFDYLSDPRNELEWNPNVETMDKISDGPIGVGSKFRAKWTKSKLVTMECTKYDRPHAWCYVNDGPVVVELNIELSATGDLETVLSSRFEAHPRGTFRLIFPFFLIMMRREEARNMQLLRQALES
ncbi:MAG: SRPBCC family protein, partial [Ilumatobacteraceae bacterium]